MPGPGKYSSSKAAEEAAWAKVGRKPPTSKRKPKKKPKPTPEQQRTADAASRRQDIIKAAPGTTGLQVLQRALAPKPKKKK